MQQLMLIGFLGRAWLHKIDFISSIISVLSWIHKLKNCNYSNWNWILFLFKFYDECKYFKIKSQWTESIQTGGTWLGFSFVFEKTILTLTTNFFQNQIELLSPVLVNFNYLATWVTSWFLLDSTCGMLSGSKKISSYFWMLLRID